MSDHDCERCGKRVDCLVGFQDHNYCMSCFEIELNGTGEPLKRLREMLTFDINSPSAETEQKSK